MQSSKAEAVVDLSPRGSVLLRADSGHRHKINPRPTKILFQVLEDDLFSNLGVCAEFFLDGYPWMKVELIGSLKSRTKKDFAAVGLTNANRGKVRNVASSQMVKKITHRKVKTE